ncbi:MAG: type III pantothenate kinase [Peptostreptococcaceae bacterium]|nr:type III pantothenate kinase [Peptostreptococcaceae bacterium]
MLLVLDVGNTNIVVGVFDGKELISSYRMGTSINATSDEYSATIAQLLNMDDIKLSMIEDVIISSVVPEVMHSLENFALKHIGKAPMVIGPGIKTGINIKYENPTQVGADRIVNAVAGYEKYGGPLIIIDFGTATTFCFINEKGEYHGGLIAPGVKISSEALFQRASKLHKVELVKPKNVVGKNTTVAMQAGIYYGYIGMVDNIVRCIKEEMNTPHAKVISTGGLASLFIADTQNVEIIDKNLTLDGLRLIYEKNKQGEYENR